MASDRMTTELTSQAIGQSQPDVEDVDRWEEGLNGTSFSHYVNAKEPEAKPSYTVYDFADPEDPAIAKDEGKVWTRTKKVSKVNAPLSVFREETGKKTGKRAEIKPEPKIKFRIVFIKNPSPKALQELGPHCGLRSGDWRLATRWTSIPETTHVNAQGIWMSLELMTVWKAKGSSATAPTCPRTNENGLSKWLRRKGPYDLRTLQTDDDVIGSWNLRRTAVLFSKQKNSKGEEKWIFLVFIEPEEEGKELVFVHRVVDNPTSDRPANAFYEDGKLMYCFEKEDDIGNLVNHIAIQLERAGPDYLIDIGEKILWGWGEFLKTMREQILSIRDNTDTLAEISTTRHCWRLFRYRLILNKTTVLGRAMKLLCKLKKEKITTVEFSKSDRSLKTINLAIKQDLELIDSTVKMLQNNIAIRNAEESTKSSKNTEFLSIMAGIFLPLTLFTGAFGMNIRELGTNGPAWWWVPTLSIPITMILLTFILGRARYTAHREYKKLIAGDCDAGLWA